MKNFIPKISVLSFNCKYFHSGTCSTRSTEASSAVVEILKKSCCRNQNKKKGSAGSTRLEFLALHVGKQSFLLKIRHNNLSNWNKPRKQKHETITWLIIEINPRNNNLITWNKPWKQKLCFPILRSWAGYTMYVSLKKDYTKAKNLLLTNIWIFGRKFKVRRCWLGKKVFPSYPARFLHPKKSRKPI